MNRKTTLFTLLLALMIIFSACSPAAQSTSALPVDAEPTEVMEEKPTEPPAPTEPPPPSVLKVANTANITTWDPIGSFSTEAAYLANMYEQLLRVNPPGALEPFTPLLATSWESNEDGTVWTFHLREGVKFHDGEPAHRRGRENVSGGCGGSCWGFLYLVGVGSC
ncbi:MAG: hypothetical protein HC806_09740 [Anaerolineae bacterium]|nr:hypothetical protein [Anaerolineae bacterium]